MSQTLHVCEHISSDEPMCADAVFQRRKVYKFFRLGVVMIPSRASLELKYKDIATHTAKIKKVQGEILAVLAPGITDLIETEFSNSFGISMEDYSEKFFDNKDAVKPRVDLSEIYPAHITVGLIHLGETYLDPEFTTKEVVMENAVLAQLKSAGYLAQWNSRFDNNKPGLIQ